MSKSRWFSTVSVRTSTAQKDGADLIRVLSDPTEPLICSLVQKFGRSGEMSDADVNTYIDDIQQNRSDGFQPSGKFFRLRR